MTELSIKVETEGDNKKGAKFIISEDVGDKKYVLVEENSIDELKKKYDLLKDDLLGQDGFLELLSQMRIDAYKLRGKDPSQFSLEGHKHEGEYAPFDHASSENIYGTGDEFNYGHVKLVNTIEEFNRHITSKDHAISVNLYNLLKEDLRHRESNNEVRDRIETNDYICPKDTIIGMARFYDKEYKGLDKQDVKLVITLDEDKLFEGDVKTDKDGMIIYELKSSSNIDRNKLVLFEWFIEKDISKIQRIFTT